MMGWWEIGMVKRAREEERNRGRGTINEGCKREGKDREGRGGRNGTSDWVETSCLITNELLMN